MLDIPPRRYARAHWDHGAAAVDASPNVPVITAGAGERSPTRDGRPLGALAGTAGAGASEVLSEER